MARHRGCSLLLVVAALLGSCTLHAQSDSGRFQVGAQYTYFHQQHGYFSNHNMLGGRFDVRLTRYFWAVSQLDVGLINHPPPTVSSISGGRPLLGNFGLKAGVQRRAVGLFGEVRGGFLSSSEVVKFVDFDNGIIRFGRLTAPLFNVGTTFEVYPTRRVGLRISAGDSIVFYPSDDIVAGSPPKNGTTTNNLQVSSGVFFRF